MDSRLSSKKGEQYTGEKGKIFLRKKSGEYFRKKWRILRRESGEYY
jgi:hypothetical protein